MVAGEARTGAAPMRVHLAELRRPALSRQRSRAQSFQSTARRPHLLQGNEGRRGIGKAARLDLMLSRDPRQPPSVWAERFFHGADQTAAAAAAGLLPHIGAEMRIGSVLDVGCARGVWLAWWLRHGVPDVVGVDGPYVDPEQLAIPRA